MDIDNPHIQKKKLIIERGNLIPSNLIFFSLFSLFSKIQKDVKNAGKKNSRRYRSRSLSASSTDSYSSGKEGSIKSLNTLSKNPRLLRTFSHTRVHSSTKILVGKNRRMSSPPISEKFDLNFLFFFGRGGV